MSPVHLVVQWVKNPKVVETQWQKLLDLMALFVSTVVSRGNERIQLSIATVQKIIRKQIKYQKTCMWVPKKFDIATLGYKIGWRH